jgi:4-hydroxybenzoate polyprenyltransferase
MFRDFLETGRILLAFGTISFILLGITYLDAPLSWEMVAASLAAGFFTTLGIYSFNHVTDLSEDRVNKPDSALVSGRLSENQILAFSFICKGLAILSAYFVGWASMALVAGAALVSFLYSYRLFGVGRLKDIYVVKSITVAATYAASLGVPVLGVGSGISPTYWILVFFVFIQILIGTIVADLKDVEGDRKSGVKTIPAAIGKERTMVALIALNSIALLALICGFWAWGLKQYLLLLPLVCLWRYYTFGAMYENRMAIEDIYVKMDNPTYIMTGVLALIGKYLGL